MSLCSQSLEMTGPSQPLCDSSSCVANIKFGQHVDTSLINLIHPESSFSTRQLFLTYCIQILKSFLVWIGMREQCLIKILNQIFPKYFLTILRVAVFIGKPSCSCISTGHLSIVVYYRMASKNKALECFLQRVKLKNSYFCLSGRCLVAGAVSRWGFCWDLQHLWGGNKCGDLSQFQQCCKTTMAPLCGWKTVIRFFFVHSKHAEAHTHIHAHAHKALKGSIHPL